LQKSLVVWDFFCIFVVDNQMNNAMAKKSFKEYHQGCLFPQSLDSMISQDSPARLLSQNVDSLDITKVIDTYKGGGCSSYYPLHRRHEN
jgi:transposase